LESDLVNDEAEIAGQEEHGEEEEVLAFRQQMRQAIEASKQKFSEEHERVLNAVVLDVIRLDLGEED